MKANRLIWTLLLLVLNDGCGQQSASETSAKRPTPTNYLGPGGFAAPAKDRATAPAALEETRAKAEKGDMAAQFDLGVRCENGQGVQENSDEAVKWYRKAAEQGHSEAQFRLGKMYMLNLSYVLSHGVTDNFGQAAKWFRKAAEQGNADAQENLGIIYYLGGGGVTKDAGEGAKWYRKAAERGNSFAQVALGRIC